MVWVQNLRFGYIFMEPVKTHGIYNVLTSSASETVVFAALCNTTLSTTTSTTTAAATTTTTTTTTTSPTPQPHNHRGGGRTMTHPQGGGGGQGDAAAYMDYIELPKNWQRPSPISFSMPRIPTCVGFSHQLDDQLCFRGH